MQTALKFNFAFLKNKDCHLVFEFSFVQTLVFPELFLKMEDMTTS